MKKKQKNRKLIFWTFEMSAASTDRIGSATKEKRGTKKKI
jgi:hypothetical protein